MTQLQNIIEQAWEDRADIVFIPATTALYRLAPPAFLAAYTFAFKSGQALDEAAL